MQVTPGIVELPDGWFDFRQIDEISRPFLRPRRYRLHDFLWLKHACIPDTDIVQAVSRRMISRIVDHAFAPVHRQRRFRRNLGAADCASPAGIRRPV
jgi:hypothetical protein